MATGPGPAFRDAVRFSQLLQEPVFGPLTGRLQ